MFGCPGAVFLLTEFPLLQKKSVSFTFRSALIFVDTYAHTSFLEVNSISHFSHFFLLFNFQKKKERKE
jgi:hypothetical protein